MREGWTRRAPLSCVADDATELWELWEEGALRASLPVRVRLGKPLDVRALRDVDADAHRAAARELMAAARALHSEGGRHGPCPCCGFSEGERLAGIAGVDYLRCGSCGHGHAPRPPAAAVRARFAADEEIAAVYTDRGRSELRMRQVVEPKLDWALRAAERILGRAPDSLLDIGAGAGHMVAAARSRGLRADGYELNRHCCDFAAAELGVELRRGDVLEAGSPDEPFDMVTLWGVLEYVPEPLAMLRRAAELIAPGGALIVEVPRVESLSTAVQRLLPATVARHLDPGSHLNAFSDASLATALWRSGLAPAEAWYFGMDAFELLAQLGLRGSLSDEAAEAVLGLQPDADRARWCDDLVIAATGAPA